MVLHGIGFEAGDLVLVSGVEHNAVMRPLKQLEKVRSIRLEQMPYVPGSIVDLKQLEELVSKRRPRLCAFLEASNLTGEMLDLESVSEILHKYDVPLLVDAAQSAGVFQSKISSLSALRYWCASGHKGLLGMAGVGLLYVHPELDLEPLVFGGTGSRSEEMSMPSAYPDHLEAGTMPAPAIVSLGAGLEFIQKTGTEVIAKHEIDLASELLDWLSAKPEFNVVGASAKKRIPVVSFEIKGMDSARVAELLDRDYGICVRAGLHCASSAHRSLGTVERGLLRASFSYFNKKEELEQLKTALSNISAL